MFFAIRHPFVWLRRFGSGRGFGVQSPWAYHLVRYVINEHYPYGNYKYLKRMVYGLSNRERKLCKLYFRLAKYIQPETIVDFAPETKAYGVYFKSGCKQANIRRLHENITLDDLRQLEKSNIGIARISLKGNYDETTHWLIDRMHAPAVLIVQGIHRNKQSLAYWKLLMEDAGTGVSFDLYYCGLIFFDKKMYKQNYKINF